jgi:hypothetical protein
MSLPKWQPPKTQKPSGQNRGESEKAPIFEAVGRALSEWEHAEMAMARLFGALIESESDAAALAYGTINGANGRREAISYASEEFFAGVAPPTHKQKMTMTMLPAL